MASLFDSIGNGIKGLFGDNYDLGSRAAAAAAIGAGDYAGAAKINANRKAGHEAQAIQQHAFQALKALGAPDDVAITIASDPEKAAEFLSSKYQDRQYGDGGGSVSNGFTGQYSTAPRFDSNGNYYAPSKDASQAPTRLISGTKVLPLTQGGTVATLDSITGARLDHPDAPTPVKVSSEADVAALPAGATFIAPDGSIKVKPGGQTPPASGNFPH